MNQFTTQSRIIITCNKRLSPYLEMEVRELGFTPVAVFSTGIELKGTVLDCIKLNLNLRCGSQVHYALKDFKADSPIDIYKHINAMAWEQLIPADGYFS